jgi:putative ABC transport system permease protein
MNGMLLNTAEALQLSQQEQSSLGDVDEDSLFGSDEGEDSLFSDSLLTESGTPDPSKQDWDQILGDTSQREFLSETDPNAWNFMLVRVDDHARTPQVISQLNDYFAQEGIEARAWNWLEGAGMSAQLADTISIVFNVLLFIVAIVAVIIIMNTLVISVSERFGEIGTMRAIGARKGFVRKMITLETLMISIVFGLVGVVIGILILMIFRAVGIEASNQFLQILLGGGVFRPMVSSSAIFSSVLMLTAVGIVSSLYPVSVALKISPLEAMNKG